MPADGAADKILGGRDRDFDLVAEGETGGDRRGIGAAGSVGGDSLNERRRKFCDRRSAE